MGRGRAIVSVGARVNSGAGGGSQERERRRRIIQKDRQSLALPAGLLDPTPLAHFFCGARVHLVEADLVEAGQVWDAYYRIYMHIGRPLFEK